MQEKEVKRSNLGPSKELSLHNLCCSVQKYVCLGVELITSVSCIKKCICVCVAQVTQKNQLKWILVPVKKPWSCCNIIQLRLFLFWSLHFLNWVSSYRWILIVMLNKKVRFLCEKVWESERRQNKYLENKKEREHKKERKEEWLRTREEKKLFISIIFNQIPMAAAFQTSRKTIRKNCSLLLKLMRIIAILKTFQRAAKKYSNWKRIFMEKEALMKIFYAST